MKYKERITSLEPEIATKMIEELGIRALQNALAVHNSLGRQGLDLINRSKYTQTLRGDFETEKAVLDTLEEEESLSFLVYAEEHGTVRFDQKQDFLAVLDGIDGSRSYKEKYGEGRYATMFGVFSNTDPHYKDYIFCGIMEHATGRLYYAVKGKGAFILQNGQKTQICCSGDTCLTKDSKIMADTNFDKVFQLQVVGSVINKLSDFDIKCDDSSAAHYASLAAGEIDAVIECTRKGNLELGVAYGLVREAGGVTMALDGIDIGDKKFNQFGQSDHIPVISASNKSIATVLLSKINN